MTLDFQILDSKYLNIINDDEVQITDKKGDKFVLKNKEIFDMSAKPSTAEGILTDDYTNFTPVQVMIADSLGNTISDSDLLDSIKKDELVALDVEFEATHTGGNDNHYIYTSDALSNATSSWMYPFAKPLIKNHDTDSEPLGRVNAAEFRTSALDAERETVGVTFRVSDRDAMTKFADGRYRTMSIGGSVQDVTCNICGKDILKDGKFKFCGHWRGEVYANQKATWTAKSMTFREGSVVNTPADKLAQVVSIKAIKAKEDGAKVANSTNDNLNVIDDIDAILDTNVSTDPIVEPITEPVIEPVVDNEPVVEAEPVVEDNVEETLKVEIADLKAKISELEKNVEDKDAEIQTLNDSITSKDAEIQTLKDEAVVNEADMVSVKDQVKRLAVFNKQLLKDHAKVLNSELTDEELESKTAKELKIIIDAAKTVEASTEVKPTVVAPVANPGASVIDKHTIVENPVENNKPAKRAAKKTTLSGWDKY